MRSLPFKVNFNQTITELVTRIAAHARTHTRTCQCNARGAYIVDVAVVVSLVDVNTTAR